MDICEIVNQYKIKEEFKPILIGFFEIKKSIYELEDLDIAQKIKETMCNIKCIKYTNKANIDAVYNCIKNEIVIGKKMSNRIKKFGLNYSVIQSIFHELSYAYDSKSLSKSKRYKYIVDGEKIKLKLMLKQGIHPFQNGILKTGKYVLLDECLNEAKTQILLQLGTNSSELGDSSKLVFNECQELQPVFEILCSVNKMNYLEFLRNIEGKDIDQISYMMCINNGISKNETDTYLEYVAECSQNMYIEAMKCISNNVLTDEEKKEYMENSYRDYDKLYSISKNYIYNTNNNTIDKKIRYDKLNIVENKVNSMFFSKNDPRIEAEEINNENEIKDKELPAYNGKHIGISKIILDSNSRNYIYKNKTITFIQRIKNKFSKNIKLLREVNVVENMLNNNGSFNSSLKSINIKDEEDILEDIKL